MRRHKTAGCRRQPDRPPLAGPPWRLMVQPQSDLAGHVSCLALRGHRRGRRGRSRRRHLLIGTHGK
ncbi:MAG: hypothetical protein AVDCRST_MAG08-3918 [uncultured Acetobacteraceae bacterium]|uniref:Uncharacterized protein n=1 Tax=uncultured Acetobacteraceae bacterium TaxID=169975 RepID=A0A6J4JNA2_9PROT|nr:MAG: hypothetical protein AVDCRST_MAG08-3918 [uncultured Acetobacteraceae bacterium]